MNPKIDINFRVTSDLYYLHIQDLSCWGIAEKQPAVIEITSPGYRESTKMYFHKKDTSYNATNLHKTCGDDCDLPELSDGIYFIRLVASPEKFNHETYFLKTDKFQKDFDKLYIKELEKDCKDCAREQLREIEFQMLASNAYLRQGQIKKSGEIFKIARKKLDRMLNCKDC